jgi:hypothetical protein
MSVWVCLFCEGKKVRHMGVPNHRAMHRRRKDGPVVMESPTHRYRYDFRERAS